MDINYYGAIRMILGLLPHMTERRFGHIVNVSSIGVQANPPRFAAYVASKAALDAFSRIVATETYGDGVTFTSIHMPLVRTPMISPTKLYDAFPTISPDEAAKMVMEALIERPKEINTRLGTAGEVAYALAPQLVDQLLHVAYRVFPDSAAARGVDGDERHRASRPPPGPPTHSSACSPACTGRAYRAYGVRPMNASSWVCASASSGTLTRGPYWPL